MVRTRFTSVGKTFAGLMFLFYIASITSQSGLLLLFIGLIGCCFVVNWSFARRNVRNLQILAPKVVEIVEGESPKEPWRIENHGVKNAECMDVLHHAGVLFRLPTVKAKDAVTVVPMFRYERRGVFPNAEVSVTCAAPYGLLRSTRKLQLEGEIVVLPRIYETSVPAGAGLDFVSGGRFRGNRRVSSGTNFAGIRPWQAGDALKQVHWKSTARRDQLMVKTFEEELGGRLSVFLDCEPGDGVVVDNAVRAAASLGAAALQEGHHFELRDGVSEPLRLAPFSDEGELLLRLARYSVPEKPATASVALEQFWRKSTLIVLGTKWRPSWTELISGARAQNRRVCVLLPEGASAVVGADAEIGCFGASSIRFQETVPA